MPMQGVQQIPIGFHQVARGGKRAKLDELLREHSEEVSGFDPLVAKDKEGNSALHWCVPSVQVPLLCVPG